MSDKVPTDRQLELATERTELAAERTRDAIERTLMAWIRTTLSMISFGFGLFKLFEYLPGRENEQRHAFLATKSITLSLVVLGTVLLIGAMVQYRSALRRLRREHPQRNEFPLAFVAASAIALIGFFAMLNLLFRWGGF